MKMYNRDFDSKDIRYADMLLRAQEVLNYFGSDAVPNVAKIVALRTVNDIMDINEEDRLTQGNIFRIQNVSIRKAVRDRIDKLKDEIDVLHDKFDTDNEPKGTPELINKLRDNISELVWVLALPDADIHEESVKSYPISAVVETLHNDTNEPITFKEGAARIAKAHEATTLKIDEKIKIKQIYAGEWLLIPGDDFEKFDDVAQCVLKIDGMESAIRDIVNLCLALRLKKRVFDITYKTRIKSKPQIILVKSTKKGDVADEFNMGGDFPDIRDMLNIQEPRKSEAEAERNADRTTENFITTAAQIRKAICDRIIEIDIESAEPTNLDATHGQYMDRLANIKRLQRERSTLEWVLSLPCNGHG